MEVLLTGSSGFVGSHILEVLLERNITTRLLLRPTANRQWLRPYLDRVRVCDGSITAAETLPAAVQGVTHIIHCAGLTKSYRSQDFYRVNEGGVRNLVAAIDTTGVRLRRLVLISSLAAMGPAGSDSPARESDPPRPISEYGRSKLAGEQVLRESGSVPYVILRPSGVYGPRDTDFLRLFQAVRFHLNPCFGGGRQPLSLLHVADLAKVTAVALTQAGVDGGCFHVATDEVVTARELGQEVARQMECWTIPLRLPLSALWPVCLAQEMVFRLSGKPQILTRLKYPELVAPGWVCSVEQLRKVMGWECPTTLRKGVADTLAWYRAHEWM